MLRVDLTRGREGHGTSLCVFPLERNKNSGASAVFSLSVSSVVFFFSCTSASAYWFQLYHVKWLLPCVN